MMGRTHLALGAVAGVHLAAAAPGLGLPVAAAALLGSILPDLDTPYSKLGRRLWPLSRLVYWSFGHRGGTHSAVFLVFAAALLAVASPPVGIALGAGIATHLAADAVSYGYGQRFTFRGAGVPLFWPLSERKAGFRLLKVNGLAENLVVLPWALLWAGQAGWRLI
ncbi:metal-dependent hydrolase [Limimaricola pyoseonensis]|uniref:Inner membrane protein n=1 Tax=Limimaricola pyoseonensis TaxID=521013 RepID=A0A1G7IT65_9RHOB|nr:metal-dependent hydrolase [Limimaricola pyoseonensis]SDF15867.1 inner membrane protein [Limimaricola pyoseonensis]